MLDAPTVRDPHLVGSDDCVQGAAIGAAWPARLPAPRPAIRRSKSCCGSAGAVADKLHPLAAKPIDADIAAVLRGINDISPKPWPVRFKEWQARGGQIEIIKARVQQDDVIAVGAGTLKLTPRGGLDGNSR